VSDDIHTLAARTWAEVAERFPNYDLVTPGTPSFVCLTGDCPVHCCKRFSVSLGERERDRLEAVHGIAPGDFLEMVDGEPLAMPLAQPFLLARREGRCVLLRDDLLCGAHEGRPDACRLYPHFVLFFQRETLRPNHADTEGMRTAMHAVLAGDLDAMPYVPLLVRHRECPGFVGPPYGEGEWRALFAETARLQYADGAPGWPEIGLEARGSRLSAGGYPTRE